MAGPAAPGAAPAAAAGVPAGAAAGPTPLPTGKVAFPGSAVASARPAASPSKPTFAQVYTPAPDSTAPADTQAQAKAQRGETIPAYRATVDRDEDTNPAQGFTALHLAAQKGDVASLTAILDKSAEDINTRTEPQLLTPLHLAAEAGHLECVEKLLRVPGVLINALDVDGRTPQLAAVHQGNLKVVNRLNHEPPEEGQPGLGPPVPIVMHFQIHYFAQHGYMRALMEQLDRGAPVDLLDENKRTPLHKACLFGHFKVAEELVVSRKANILLASSQGRTPILYAAEGGNPDMVKLLLDAAAKLSSDHKTTGGWGINLLQHRTKDPKAIPTDAGLTPLLLAAKNGHAAFVRAALSHKANIKAVDKNGHSALHHACLGGTGAHLEVLKVLLEKDLDSHLCNSLDEFGYTPLLLASNHQGGCSTPTTCGHQEMVQILRKAKADMHFELHLAALGGHTDRVRKQLACKCAEFCKEQTCAKLADPISGITALHLAAKSGKLDVVEDLIKAGANVNALDINSNSPLMNAASGGHAEVVEELLKAGAFVYQKNLRGETALHRVASASVPDEKNPAVDTSRKGELECMRHLITAAQKLRNEPVTVEVRRPAVTKSTVPGATMRGGGQTMGATMKAIAKEMETMTDESVINARTFTRKDTALTIAAHDGHLQLVRILLEKGRADATERDANKFLPLHHAAKHGWLQICKELIKAGSPMLSRNYKGCMALHCAAGGGHVDVVEFLLSTRGQAEEEDSKSLVDVGDDSGLTSLHYAAMDGRTEVVKLLLAEKADPYAVTDALGTPFHMAVRENVDVVKVFLEAYRKIDGWPMQPDATGFTPLHYAVDPTGDNDDPEASVLAIVKAIVEYTEVPSKDEEPEQCRAKTRKLLNQLTKTANSALGLACEAEYATVVKYLLEKGATVKDGGKVYPVLHTAAQCTNPAILELILRNINKDPDNPELDAEPSEVLRQLRLRNWEGDTAIHVAAANNNLKAVRALLKNVADAREKSPEDRIVNTPITNGDGWYAIHSAAEHGHLDVIKMLHHEMGKDLQMMTSNGRTPLHIAAAFGQVDIVKFLLSEHCDMELMFKPDPERVAATDQRGKWAYQEDRCTIDQHPVYNTATILPTQPTENLKRKVVPGGGALLLEFSLGISYYEVTINEMVKDKDDDGRPLVPNMSIGIGNDKVVLSEEMKPPGLHRAYTFGYCSRNGYVYSGGPSTGQQYGPLFGEGDTIGVVFNRANRTVSFTKNGEHLGLAVRGTQFPIELNPDDMSAMLGWNSTGIKELQVNFGDDPERPFLANADDLLWQEEAIYNPAGEKEPWRCKELLHPLHLAICARALSVVLELLKHGADIYQKDADGWTTLHFASHEGWVDGIQVLLDEHKKQLKKGQHKASGPAAPEDDLVEVPPEQMAMFVDKGTKYGCSPLLLAIKNSHSNAAKILIEEGKADCKVVDEQHRTLLMHAAKTGNVETMKLLISKGVAVKTKDQMGRTALQYAANEAAVEFLEAQGNSTIPYEGRDYLLLRVDIEVKTGAVGSVLLAKWAKNGNPLAIKMHDKTAKDSRDTSFDMLKSFGNVKEARNYIACLPTGMDDSDAKFDDHKQHADHPYALVLEGGDQTLLEVLAEVGEAGGAPGQPPCYLPDNQCRFIFDCLVTAVNYVHTFGYVHHDLKTRNFVRFFDGRYKLIDFDNSRQENDDMGQTTVEICPPEAAKDLARDRNRKVKSQKSMDIWALGVVFYEMVTHRHLLCDIANWPQKDIYAHDDTEALEILGKVSDLTIGNLLLKYVPNPENSLAFDLLSQLLKVAPKSRPVIADVVNNPYLKGTTTMKAVEGQLKKLNTNVTEMSSKIDTILAGVLDIKARMVKLEELPDLIRNGFKDMSAQIKDFRAMVMQTHKASCPTTFIIGPDLTASEALTLKNGKSEGASAVSSWVSGLKTAFIEGGSMADFAESLTHKRYRLQLVCERCGLPQGEGYVLKQPKEWVGDFLPVMQVSFRIMKIANVALGLGSIMFPGLPTLPDGVLEKGDDMLDMLSKKSSAEEFTCVQDALDKKDGSFQQQCDNGLRQLAAFLEKADPMHGWGGLALIDLQEDKPSQAKAIAKDSHGMPQTVMWVCKGCLTGTCPQPAGPPASTPRPLRATGSGVPRLEGGEQEQWAIKAGAAPRRSADVQAQPAGKKPLALTQMGEASGSGSGQASPKKKGGSGCFGKPAVHPE